MDELLKKLQQAVEGLLYPSESDEPFKVFDWPPAAGNAFDQMVSHANGQPVVEVAIPAFFDELTNGDSAEKFADLRDVLDKLLPGLKIFRICNGPEVGIFLIGRLPNGRWVGARTQSVET